MVLNVATMFTFIKIVHPEKCFMLAKGMDSVHGIRNPELLIDNQKLNRYLMVGKLKLSMMT